MLVLARYAFRSEEKVALQEIGPRFTLKLRSLRKGIPAVQNFGEAPKKTEIEVGVNEEPQDESQVRGGIAGSEDEKEPEKGKETGEDEMQADEPCSEETSRKVIKPPKQDEFLWVWKVCRFLFAFLDANMMNVGHFASPSWKRHGGRSFCRYLIL